ncbi:hypothetical protein [Thalassoglobus polymorphus]|uniref:Uncharacterized protein n=1 Tax=Thalassoglobus polymorphus TaxID=2527994 RepID=A0A517QP96_9PLAN|nr:hypothetical protein [Thalassoglobus polymorphus]QDT33432.1 hypothetical protein Mal48_26850 [Thalassoglobus polymorphus]
MNRIVKNILAIVVGFLIGSIVNIGLVNLGMAIVPLPDGADVSTMEGVRESMKLLTPMNFVFPFLAHALGTLAGAYTAARMAASFQMLIAIGIGLFFLMGGIMMVVMCGGPIWFIASDLLLAYLPMSFLGAILARKTKPLTPEQHDPS